MRPFLSIELAGTVLLTGLIISLWNITLQLSATVSQSENIQQFRNTLLLRASKELGQRTTKEDSGETIALTEILDVAQQARLNITDTAGTKYESAQESFRHGVRLSNEIDGALRLKQADLVKQATLTVCLIAPLVCLLIWTAYSRRTKTTSPKNTVVQNAEADRTIQKLSNEVGKLHDSMMKSITLSANSVRSPFIHSPSALGILREDYTIEYANNAFSELTKSSVSELIGKSIVEFVKCQRGEKIDSLPLPLNDLEAVVVDKRGNSVAAEISISRYEGPQRSGLVISIIDVSKRSELLRIRTDTLTEVSHDIRTPMTSLKLFLAMITEGYYGTLPPSAIEALNKVLPQVDRLIRLTGNILSSDELESGTMRLRVAPAQLTNAIESAVSSLEGTARSKGQTVSTKIDNQIAACLIDPERMIQVLVNLVSNALKYSPKNALVEISAFTDQNFVIVEIADEGPGISLEQSEIMFRKFERGSAEEQGSGIGLWICRRILELHGGTLEVRPRPRRTGSVFRLALPMIDSPRYNSVS